MKKVLYNRRFPNNERTFGITDKIIKRKRSGVFPLSFFDLGCKLKNALRRIVSRNLHRNTKIESLEINPTYKRMLRRRIFYNPKGSQ
jgi:hypothetical protein